MVSVCGTLSAISNDKSLVLFNTIALASGNTQIPITRLKFTRKQYYSRISELINAGLVIRRSGNYFLTSFGKVVYEAQELIGKAVQYYPKLQGIDSIKTPEFPDAELSRIIDTLINDIKIKEILISTERNNNYNDAENDKTCIKELIVSAPT
jgi:hypothetical protein